MATRFRYTPASVFTEGIVARMRRLGLESLGAFPTTMKILQLGPDLSHLCYGDDLEIFSDGVPVLRTLRITQTNGTQWQVTLPYGTDSYWSGPIRLSHEWNQPPRGWRPLHCLEAASLLAMNPGLGSVRYHSSEATLNRAEIKIMPNGQMRVDCGSTPLLHHLACVEGPAPYNITELRVR